MELTNTQMAEVIRLKQHYPARIIYCMIDKDTKQFTCSAVLNMRIPNKLAREGHQIFIAR